MSLDTGNDAAGLLSTALEKLLYLESRLEAAEAAREDASRETDRQRASAREARRSLGEWRKRATEAEVAAEGAEREVSKLRESLEHTRGVLQAGPSDPELASRLADAEDRLGRFQRERELWLDRMVALGRLRTDDDDALDLGSFIAELRAELVALRRGEADRPRATLGDRPPKPEARALLDETRAAQVDPEQLANEARLPRPERTLAILCARDLRSDSAIVRQRAAERLAEAGIGALTPFAVEVLHGEPDPRVRGALVALVDRTGGASATLVLVEAGSDADARVRTASLEGLARRGALDRVDFMKDSVPAVRRRGLTLLPRDARSLDFLADALRDDDASVRKVAVLALARRSGPEAVALLTAASTSEDAEVSRLALEALALRGVDPARAVAVDETPVAVEEAPSEPSAADPIDDMVLDEVRISLRGRTREELVDNLRLDPDALAETLERLVARGLAVWRGPKLYLP